ncbi:unnamed protein product, partial [Phaeothamnion confervicola]
LLGIAWKIGGGYGWGTAGLNVALASPHVLAVPLYSAVPDGLSPAQAVAAEATVGAPIAAAAEVLEEDIGTVVQLPFPVVHCLGTFGTDYGVDTILGAFSGGLSYWGTVNIGVIFAEAVAFTARDVALLRRFDAVLAGSRWNRGLLVAAGLPQPRVGLFLQGVDHAAFDTAAAEAAAAAEKRDGEFWIFSGGKLEFRKGQDIVIATFRLLRAQFPGVRLAVVWANRANRLTENHKTIAYSPHVRGFPRRFGLADDEHGSVGLSTEEIGDDGDGPVGDMDVVGWLAANGVDPADVVDLGPVPHAAVPALLRGWMDAALFPNRCEGGTNLVAMEAVAAGVPTVLSANTGHLDLIAHVGADLLWP